MQHLVRSVLLHGIRLPYVEHGDPDGVPVVFLHGYTDSWRSYETVLPNLPRSIRAFALTQRGHGDADRPATGYRPQDFARDVAGFLDAHGIERAVVVGHSMGGSVAQRFAIDYPDRLAGLILVGARASWHDQPDVAGLIEHVTSSLGDTVDPQFAREFQQSTIAQPVPPGWLEIAIAESLKLPASTWRAVCEQGVAQADLTGLLVRIDAPTLLVCGDLDSYARDGQQALLQGIADSRLEWYAGAGHALHWEEPQRFARQVVEFVRQVGAIERRLATA
ncbi:MAG TPA: alpha/beta hydrolase [Steroidobacteraceae bacterium]|nr:alpha/beta hydrolase [Steroidobacteraceae bacterium]